MPETVKVGYNAALVTAETVRRLAADVTFPSEGSPVRDVAPRKRAAELPGHVRATRARRAVGPP